jgi:hypothetical protein
MRNGAGLPMPGKTDRTRRERWTSSCISHPSRRWYIAYHQACNHMLVDLPQAASSHGHPHLLCMASWLCPAQDSNVGYQPSLHPTCCIQSYTAQQSQCIPCQSVTTRMSAHTQATGSAAQQSSQHCHAYSCPVAATSPVAGPPCCCLRGPLLTFFLNLTVNSPFSITT